ncbi:MAG: protein-L-isoaspartate O-methyltransferase [Deltaproteobacteria bacterium]|nr:protein-L-isoaspartate O-methyltransferase [Deltaproteobacteria bacterium]
MQGWRVPPPKEPTKTKEELKRERERKVRSLLRYGYLRAERIKNAMLKVPREDFMPQSYRDYAYLEVPFPLPGEEASISCPHSYPLFYEPLGLAGCGKTLRSPFDELRANGAALEIIRDFPFMLRLSKHEKHFFRTLLDEGHRFLEVGLGSGYGTALAREIVGNNGLVVSIEIDPLTFEYARKNLEAAGYRDIVLVKGDGGLGYPKFSPYDRICITAACTEIPPPLLEHLKVGGMLIAPVLERGVQNLVLHEKRESGFTRQVLCEVLYVSLRGKYARSGKPAP